MPTLGAKAQTSEPYVVLKDGTATFYYNDSKPKGALPIQTFKDENWTEKVKCSVKKVVFDNSFKEYKPTNCSYWFCGFENLTEIAGMKENLNTENVMNMYSMFDGCYSLTILDLGNFNTANVKYMDYMFYQCYSLETIFVGDGWTISSCSTEGMFEYCYFLVGGKGTAFCDIIDNYSLKKRCGYYARIDGVDGNSGFFTKSGEPVFVQPHVIVENGVATIYYTGYNYYTGSKPKNALLLQRKYREGTSWPHEVSSSITKVIFDDSFNAYKPKGCAYWFYGLENLTEIIGMKENLNTEDVVIMESMFQGCDNLKTLDLSGFNTAKVKSMDKMFDGCANLETIYVGDEWTTKSVSPAPDNDDNRYYTIFDGCKNLVGGKGSSYFEYDYRGFTFAKIDEGEDNPGYFTKVGEQKIIREEQAYAVIKDGIATFYYNDNKIEGSLPLQRSFQEWTEEIQSSITKIVFDESFKSYRPKNCSYWFYNLKNLIEIEEMKENLNTEYVIDMSYMFHSCSSLIALDLSNFNTSRVTDMAEMFSWCNHLSSLDLSSFNTPNVKSTAGMFYYCHFLQYIIVGDGWNKESMTGYFSNQMFTGCSHLYGGKGTAYKYDHDYGTYAIIDGGESSPGYLTKTGETPYRYVVSIEIIAMPKTDFILGEDYNSDICGRLKVTYNTGEQTTEHIDASFLIVGYDKNKIGVQTVRLLYQGCEATFTTPISSIPNTKSNTKVWSFNSTIFIEAAPDTKYTIIDLNGRTIKSATTKSSHEEISITKSGVYIVLVNGESYKVSVN